MAQERTCGQRFKGVRAVGKIQDLAIRVGEETIPRVREPLDEPGGGSLWYCTQKIASEVAAMEQRPDGSASSAAGEYGQHHLRRTQILKDPQIAAVSQGFKPW